MGDINTFKCSDNFRDTARAAFEKEILNSRFDVYCFHVAYDKELDEKHLFSSLFNMSYGGGDPNALLRDKKTYGAIKNMTDLKLQKLLKAFWIIQFTQDAKMSFCFNKQWKDAKDAAVMELETKLNSLPETVEINKLLKAMGNNTDEYKPGNNMSMSDKYVFVNFNFDGRTEQLIEYFSYCSIIDAYDAMDKLIIKVRNQLSNYIKALRSELDAVNDTVKFINAHSECALPRLNSLVYFDKTNNKYYQVNINKSTRFGVAVDKIEFRTSDKKIVSAADIDLNNLEVIAVSTGYNSDDHGWRCYSETTKTDYFKSNSAPEDIFNDFDIYVQDKSGGNYSADVKIEDAQAPYNKYFDKCSHYRYVCDSSD